MSQSPQDPTQQTPDDGRSGDGRSGGVDPRIVVVGEDGMGVSGGEEERGGSLTDLVESPAKVMRIGSMIKQLLEEVKSAPLDEAGRTRLAGVLHTSVAELKDGLAPELDAELDRLVLPFESGTPSESELRIAQAQLVGWLEGLFHGIQTAIYAQQMAARAQLEQMRRALPGAMPDMAQGQPGSEQQPGDGNGMYL